ncbi:DUF465 domain-containing protein (plasmid) [Paracoccus sp. AK26]|nr:DUF465 domain-containing protein [Paracoccus sp. AK26]
MEDGIGHAYLYRGTDTWRLRHGRHHRPDRSAERACHAAFEDQLAELLKRPSASAEEIAAIKKEKLEIKDELAVLEREAAEA